MSLAEWMGAAAAEIFEAYVKHFLAPALREGQAVVMDNLGAHKGESRRLWRREDSILVNTALYETV
jgi:transposase